MTCMMAPQHVRPETRDGSWTVRAEALFASSLQSSESPSHEEVRRAVRSTLLRLGARGCAERLADEFGDHPELAAARMTWALATLRAACPEARFESGRL